MPTMKTIIIIMQNLRVSLKITYVSKNPVVHSSNSNHLPYSTRKQYSTCFTFTMKKSTTVSEFPNRTLRILAILKIPIMMTFDDCLFSHILNLWKHDCYNCTKTEWISAGSQTMSTAMLSRPTVQETVTVWSRTEHRSYGWFRLKTINLNR